MEGKISADWFVRPLDGKRGYDAQIAKICRFNLVTKFAAFAGAYQLV